MSVKLESHPLSEWLHQSELVWQPLLLIGTLGVAYLVARLLKKYLPSETSGWRSWVRGNMPFILMFGLVSLTAVVAWITATPAALINVFTILTALWLILDFIGSHLRDRIVAKTLTIIIFLFSALYTLGLLKPTIHFLDNFTFDVVSPDLTALKVLKGIFIFIVALWSSLIASRWLGERIESIETLNPSLKVLLNKILRILLVTIAILVPISAIGLDLTIFALLGGGIGIGIGFGLQKVISNLVCGFILLVDKSIKPGDVIQIGGTYAGSPEGGIYGWINNLHARYTSVITRDGTEHLIPNEDLITQPVINWSFTHDRVRLHSLFYISYTTDVDKAIELINEGARAVDRVLDDPKPKCLLYDFSDSSIVLEARFWIKDPSNGVTSVKSAVRLNAWNLFRKHGIRVPYPQRDLHIKPPAELSVTLKRAQDAEAMISDSDS